MNGLTVLELDKYVPAKFVVNNKDFVMRYPTTGVVELDLKDNSIIISQLSFITQNKTLLMSIDHKDIDYIEINSQKAFDGGLGPAKGLIFFHFITAICIHLKTKKCYKFINQDLRELLKDIKSYNDAHYLHVLDCFFRKMNPKNKIVFKK